MSDPALHITLSFGVPTVAVLVEILINHSRLNDLRSHMDARFDGAKDTWRAELRRVGLKHLEQRKRRTWKAPRMSAGER
jgi:hypothetical protein